MIKKWKNNDKKMKNNDKKMKKTRDFFEILEFEAATS